MTGVLSFTQFEPVQVKVKESRQKGSNLLMKALEGQANISLLRKHPKSKIKNLHCKVFPSICHLT